MKTINWKRHKENWMDCDKCSLCERRSKVVLLKGKVPCDVLFVGEAPGVGEDTIGKPFVGPAGYLLDQMIEAAEPLEIRLAFTNLVACIPKDEEGIKMKNPPKDAIMKCSKRLQEVVKLCKPTHVICVGKLSSKWCRQFIEGVTFEDIIHPASILRADITQQGLAIQRNETLMGNLFRSLIPF